MTMFSEERLEEILDALIALKAETEVVEFKSNHLSPDDLGEYISALANAAALQEKPHAFLVFGIRDGDHEVVGTTFDVNMKGKGSEDLLPWLNRQVHPRVYFDFSEMVFRDKRVVVLTIQAANSTPVAFAGKRLIRVGSHRKRLSDHPELERRLWLSFQALPFELRPASDVLSDEAALRLLSWETYFELTDIAVPTTIDERLDYLLSAGFVTPADVTGWHITNMGALLLAKDLDDFPSVERKAPRVIQYDGKSRADDATEQKGVRGYAAAFPGLLNYTVRRVPEVEEFPDGIRRSVPALPQKVLRELIANALIHQDLTVTGSGPMVELFSNRIEVTNPGESLVDAIHLIDGQPRSRNEKLAKQMSAMGICDERGSGWDQIANFIEESGLPAPEIENADGYMRVIVHWDKPLSSLSKDEQLNMIFFHSLVMKSRRDRVTNASLRKRFGIPEKDNAKVSRLIRMGINEGVIKIYDTSVGAKARSYVPDSAPKR
jgi:predicted HTH transcriptional regulator